jgi:FkbM family methyltransferase
MRPLIFDIGLHHGEDADFYLKKGFDVVGVEADPAHVERARERFAGAMAEGRMSVVHAAVADAAGETAFYVNLDHDDWSSTDPKYGARDGSRVREIVVPSATLDGIIEQHAGPRAVHYVKIDIEGGDAAALRGLARSRVRPRYVSVESHTLEYAAALVTMGYGRFKLVNQNLNWLVKLPSPALEGAYVEHAFTAHSSGPFGEEAPGTWMDFEEMADIYLSVRRCVRAQPSISNGWFDFHAKLG